MKSNNEDERNSNAFKSVDVVAYVEEAVIGIIGKYLIHLRDFLNEFDTRSSPHYKHENPTNC